MEIGRGKKAERRGKVRETRSRRLGRGEELVRIIGCIAPWAGRGSVLTAGQEAEAESSAPYSSRSDRYSFSPHLCF
jgi:hypothetical protein